MEKQAQRWLILALIAAAAFYLLLLPRYPVGSAIDDALYILAGQSLMHGRYVALMLPDKPPLIDPLPGFPLILAPFTVLVGTHWAVLKLISLFSVLATAVLLWGLLRRIMPAPQAAWCSALFALNPTTAHLSGVIVSEPFFLLLCVAVLAALPKILEEENPRLTLVLGVVLGWLMLVRPQGLLFGFALGVVLWSKRKPRTTVRLLSPAVALWGIVLLRNWIQAQSVSGYSMHWKNTLPAALLRKGMLLQNALDVLRTLLGDNLLAIQGDSGSAASIVLMAAAALVIGWSAWRWLRSDTEESSVSRQVIVLFSFLYVALHIFWLAVDERYLYPILPWVLAFAVAGIHQLAARSGRRWHLETALLILIAARYVYADAAAIPWRGPAVTVPRQTYAWAREKLPANSFIFSAAPPTVRLYTGLSSLYALAPADLEEFRYYAIKRGLTHVLAQPLNLLSFKEYGTSPLDANQRWARMEQWIASWPGAFPVIYRNAQEGTVFYEVRAEPKYLAAYEAYRTAMSGIGRISVTSGIRQLEAVLRLDPEFPGAWNALGATLLISGRDLNRAEACFRRALALRPDLEVARRNLERVSRRRRGVAEGMR